MSATIWDAANKDASIILGRGATIAGKSASAGSWKSVRATTSFSSGKKYLEFYQDQPISGPTLSAWRSVIEIADAAEREWLLDESCGYGIAGLKPRPLCSSSSF
jgi:hypothetical protein